MDPSQPSHKHRTLHGTVQPPSKVYLNGVFQPKRDTPDKEALISKCELYRYWLLRQWDWDLRPACFVLLNPSTADAEKNDATVRKCMGFARRWGNGGIEIVNLFAFRSRDPKKLITAKAPVGPDNDRCIDEVILACSPVVLGWGNSIPKACRSRVDDVLKRLKARGVLPVCLGITGKGQPQHPLFVKYETPLIPFPLKG
jgi:hypothetical protein